MEKAIINLPDIPELNDFKSYQKHIRREIFEMQDLVLRQVAEQVLGRPFAPEDGKDFTIIQQEGSDYYLLAYKNECLGAIRFDMIYENFKQMAQWTFNPAIKSF